MKLSEILKTFSDHDEKIEGLKKSATNPPEEAPALNTGELRFILSQIEELHKALESAKSTFDPIFSKEGRTVEIIKDGQKELAPLPLKTIEKYHAAADKSDRVFNDAMAAVKQQLPNPAAAEAPATVQNEIVVPAAPANMEALEELPNLAATEAPVTVQNEIIAPATPASTEPPTHVEEEEPAQPSCLSRHKGKLFAGAAATAIAVAGYFNPDIAKAAAENLRTRFAETSLEAIANTTWIRAQNNLTFIANAPFIPAAVFATASFTGVITGLIRRASAAAAEPAPAAPALAMK